MRRATSEDILQAKRAMGSPNAKRGFTPRRSQLKDTELYEALMMDEDDSTTTTTTIAAQDVAKMDPELWQTSEWDMIQRASRTKKRDDTDHDELIESMTEASKYIKNVEAITGKIERPMDIAVQLPIPISKKTKQERISGILLGVDPSEEALDPSNPESVRLEQYRPKKREKGALKRNVPNARNIIYITKSSTGNAGQLFLYSTPLLRDQQKNRESGGNLRNLENQRRLYEMRRTVETGWGFLNAPGVTTGHLDTLAQFCKSDDDSNCRDYERTIHEASYYRAIKERIVAAHEGDEKKALFAIVKWFCRFKPFLHDKTISWDDFPIIIPILKQGDGTQSGILNRLSGPRGELSVTLAHYTYDYIVKLRPDYDPKKDEASKRKTGVPTKRSKAKFSDDDDEEEEEFVEEEEEEEIPEDTDEEEEEEEEEEEVVRPKRKRSTLKSSRPRKRRIR